MMFHLSQHRHALVWQPLVYVPAMLGPFNELGAGSEHILAQPYRVHHRESWLFAGRRIGISVGRSVARREHECALQSLPH